MEIYITSSIAGFIAFDENLNIIDYNLFKEEEIPSNFVKIENNEILTEEIDLINKLIKDYDNILIESNIRLSNYASYLNIDNKEKIHIQTPNRGGDYLRSNLAIILSEIGFFNSEKLDDSKKFNNNLNGLDNSSNRLNNSSNRLDNSSNRLDNNFNRLDNSSNRLDNNFNRLDNSSNRLDNNFNRLNNKSKIISIYNKIAIFKMKESSKEEDKLIIQAINSIDEIDESISKLTERIREWNIIYFPEIDIIQNNESFINLIANNTREEIVKSPPDVILKNNEIDIENGSIGADIEVEDIEMINSFAKSIQSLQKTRNKTEEYIDKKMEKLAPNLRDLLGSSLAAKLIAHIGGIKSLSMYSASTIQIMGAEKALFRHLKTGERPPKHGLIFQHPQVRTNNWWIRGKIARTLALKISLAVRKDVFSKEFDPSISESFIERVEQIKKDNPFPKKTAKRRKDERDFEKGKRFKPYRKTKKIKNKQKNKKFKNKKRKKR